MNRQSRSVVACVVLAAGLSRRFHGLKQLSKMGNKYLLQRVINSANKSDADYSYVVLGYSSSEIVARIDQGRAQILLNNNFKQGLSSSLRTGIQNLPLDCKGVIFILGDEPFVTTKHLDTMIQTFRKDPEKIVAFSFKGEARNPVLIPRIFFPEILSLEGDLGARKIVRNHADKAMLIEIKNEKLLQDIDTRSDLRKVTLHRR